MRDRDRDIPIVAEKSKDGRDDSWTFEYVNGTDFFKLRSNKNNKYLASRGRELVLTNPTEEEWIEINKNKNKPKQRPKFLDQMPGEKENVSSLKMKKTSHLKNLLKDEEYY